MWIETECRSTNININVFKFTPTPEGNVKHLLFYSNIFHVKSMDPLKIVCACSQSVSYISNVLVMATSLQRRNVYLKS